MARYKGNEMYQAQIGGTDPSYAEAGQAQMKIGRFFSEIENEHHMPVVVVGEDVSTTIDAEMIKKDK